MGVKALYYNCLDIGKHVKKSKKRYIWKFSIDGREHTIDLVVSYLSGKKKITQDGKLLYEGQKVLTSSFQFPFEIDLNMCNIVQLGDNFELRINNQAFSELYGQGGSRGGFGNDYPSSKPKSHYDESGYSKGNDYSGSRGGGYGGSGSNYGGYSSKGESYGSYSGGNRVNMDSSSYKKPNESSNRSRGWEDVRQAQREVRTGAAKEDRESGFDHGFDKFELSKENSRRTENEKKAAPSGGRSGFDDFGTDSQAKKKNDFTDFSTFDNFAVKNKNDDFSNFGNFGDFNNPQNKQPEPQKTQPQTSKQASLDILGLDFSGGNNQQQNPAPTNQTGGFDDFFGQSNQPTNTNQNQGFNQQTQPQAQSNAGDLLGLDFGNLSVQQTTQASTNNTQNTQDQGLDLFADQNQTQSQPQSQNQPPQNIQTQQAQPSKKDLWDTDLVSLNPSEVENKNNKNQFENNFDTMGNKQGGYGGGYGNQGMMGFNQGMGMGMSNNVGGFGMNAGFGGMNSGFGTGMNMNMNTNAGYGGMGMNTNTNAGGFGMNMGGNTGFGNEQYQGGFGMGGGFQQQQQFNQQQQAPLTGQAGGGDVMTPFDF